MSPRSGCDGAVMRALMSHEPGGPQSLRVVDVPIPTPRSGQVLIAVRACGVNYPDLLKIADRHQSKVARPFSPGLEVAGVIELIAPDVQGFKKGQRVMASMEAGGLAEFAVADEARCTAIPEHLPFDAAAALQITYGTAYHALIAQAALHSSDTVLVLGAAGGVGVAAIQVAKAVGATAVGAVSSPEKADFALACGADRVVIYPTASACARELSAQFRKACNGRPDVIVDSVGGWYAEAALRSIARQGRYLVIGFPAGIPSVPLNLIMIKECAVIGVFWGAWVERFPCRHQQNMAQLIEWYARGMISPPISRRFTLDEAPSAMDQLADRTVLGKLIAMVTQAERDAATG